MTSRLIGLPQKTGGIFSGEYLITLFQDCIYDSIHIVVFIFTKPPSEEYFVFSFCQCFILSIQFTVPFIVYRIVWLIPRFPFRTVLLANYSLWDIIPIPIFTKLKPLMLDYSSPRSL